MRGDQSWMRTVTSATYFNSRLYMRGNFLQSSSSCSSADFNSRLYMRGNFRPQTKHWTHWTDFNSRLYMRGNLVNCSMPPNVYYFNSRLYMRGNFCLPRSPAPQCISIHASTWEATLFWCIKLSVFKISIHASTWEATPPQSALIVGSSTFQFTPLHERQLLSAS